MQKAASRKKDEENLDDILVKDFKSDPINYVYRRVIKLRTPCKCRLFFLLNTLT